MELFTIARFHARAGRESEVEAAIHEVSVPTRAEPGCLSYHVYRGTRDGALFFIHSRWQDEAASSCTPSCRTRLRSWRGSSR